MGKYTIEALEAVRKANGRLTHNEQSAFWYLTNLDLAKKRQREYSARSRAKHRQEHPELYVKKPRKRRFTDEQIAVRRAIGCVAWRKKNAEHVKAYQVEYDARDPEGRLQRRRERYAANPERDRERRREWNRKNPEWCRTNKQKRRALKLKVGGTFTKAETTALLIAQDYRCANPYCAADLRAVPKHLDHVVALTAGGVNDVTNLQWLCGPCNQRKTNFPVEAWLAREAARCQAPVPALQEA